MTLVALHPILFRSIQYRIGDALPADSEIMVAAWIGAGSAVWKEDEETDPPKKARLVTAPPGTTGSSSDGDPEARVGHPTDTPQRKKGARRK